MVLERGPAVLLDRASLDLSIEPLLDPSDYDIQTDGIDDVLTVLDAQTPAIAQAVVDGINGVNDATPALDDVATLLSSGELNIPSAIDDAIITGQVEAETAMDDAAATIPDITDAPEVPPPTTGYGPAGVRNPPGGQQFGN